MSELHQIRFPSESDEYREARNKLLHAEMDLRRKKEEVAKQLRNLPLGGKVKEDYVFEQLGNSDETKKVKLSELFANSKNCLAIYSFMYSTQMEKACPSCTSILDSLNGNSPHITQRMNFVVVAKSPIKRVQEWAKFRRWNNLNLLSSENNSYNSDYFAETKDGDQMPMLNLFLKNESGIFHTYAT
ncbi:MAG: DUF899 family protein, partial [Gammaproteobacteria bacterium]